MRKPLLIPTLIILLVLAIGGPLLDYYPDHKQGWLTFWTVLPMVVFLVYLIVAAVKGWLRDIK